MLLGKQVQRTDSIAVDKTFFTAEGYLIDEPIVTRVGIFEYTNPDGTLRRELRLPEEVFNHDSLSSYQGKPIIVTHDAGLVTKDNVGHETIGTILSDGYQEGDNVRAKVVIHETDVLKECGLRELSLGYSLDTDETPGEWNGQHYDAIQRNIRINHLALVGAARAGEKARLNIDGKEEKGEGNMVLTRKQLAQAIIDFNKQARADGDVAVTIPQELIESGEVTVEEVGGGEEVAEDTALTAEQIKETMANETDPEKLKEYINMLLNLVPTETAVDGNNDVLPADEKEEDVTQQESNNEDSKKCDEEVEKPVNMDSIDKLVSAKLEMCRIGEKLGLNLEGQSISTGKKAIIQKVEPGIRLDGINEDTINGMYAMAKAKVSKMRSTTEQKRQMVNADGKDNVPGQNKSMAAQKRQEMINRGGEQ